MYYIGHALHCVSYTVLYIIFRVSQTMYYILRRKLNQMQTFVLQSAQQSPSMAGHGPIARTFSCNLPRCWGRLLRQCQVPKASGRPPRAPGRPADSRWKPPGGLRSPRARAQKHGKTIAEHSIPPEPHSARSARPPGTVGPDPPARPARPV